jgi:hypothetical protein
MPPERVKGTAPLTVNCIGVTGGWIEESRLRFHPPLCRVYRDTPSVNVSPSFGAGGKLVTGVYLLTEMSSDKMSGMSKMSIRFLTIFCFGIGKAGHLAGGSGVFDCQIESLNPHGGYALVDQSDTFGRALGEVDRPVQTPGRAAVIHTYDHALALVSDL